MSSTRLPSIIQPIFGVQAAPRAHGLTSPALAQVDDGDLVGRWFMETRMIVSSRDLANPLATAFTTAGNAMTRGIAGVPNPFPVIDGSKGPYVTARTGAALGNQVSWNYSLGQWINMLRNPSYVAFVRTPADITNVVYFVGLYSALGGPSGALDPGAAGTSWIGFRFNAGTDGGWVGQSRNGGTNTNSVTATIKPVLANTEYQLRVRRTSDGLIRFSVDNEPEVTKNTDLPVTAGLVGYSPMWAVRNTIAATKDFQFNSDLVYLQS